MTNQLIALLDGREVGKVHYKNARLSFVYNDAWRADPNAYPQSLSALNATNAVPLAQRSSSGRVKRQTLVLLALRSHCRSMTDCNSTGFARRKNTSQVESCEKMHLLKQTAQGVV
jgi:hypothetical protein